jgi:apolipoprotein N-acyltransferase
MALFAALAGVIMRTAWAVPTVPALWVALEATHGPLGFAWFALGNAGINLSLPMRLAPYTGVYGLSFVFAMMSAGVAVVLLRRPRGELLWLLILPLLILLPPLPEPERPQQTVVLVQPNLSMDVEWTSASVERLHRRLVSASLEAAIQAGAPKPALIVWPEVPAPLYFYEDARFRDQVATLTRVARTGLLMGTVARNQDGAPLNSALLLSSAGEPVSRYDKIKLVPFGEFVPWPFGFVNQISDEVGAFSPGREVVVSRTNGHRISTFICYESVFPNLVRRFAAAGAEVLFNISNDGYFGTSAAREQHLKIVRMRAAENGRWIVRATNNGITAAIDPAGRIRAAAPSYRETVERMPFDYRSDLTVYTRYGDWFAWLCALMAGLALYLAREYVVS